MFHVCYPKSPQHMLYESLLSHNESLGLLHNVVLLGNSLERYEDAWSGRPRDRPDRPHVMLGLVQAGAVGGEGEGGEGSRGYRGAPCSPALIKL